MPVAHLGALEPRAGSRPARRQAGGRPSMNAATLAVPPPAPPARSRRPIDTLALRERFRDDYRDAATRSPTTGCCGAPRPSATWSTCSPGQTILELGCGRRALHAAAARGLARREPDHRRDASPPGAAAPKSASTRGSSSCALDALPGALAGRQFRLHRRPRPARRARLRRGAPHVHELLKPGGQVLFFESNPWNPCSSCSGSFARLFRGADPRSLLSRPQLYELIPRSASSASSRSTTTSSTRR